MAYHISPPSIEETGIPSRSLTLILFYRCQTIGSVPVAGFNPVRESNCPWKLPLSPAKEGDPILPSEGFTQEAILVSLEGHHKLSHDLIFNFWIFSIADGHFYIF